jgi:transposase-like protein
MEPKTLQDAIRYFSDENVCIDTVANLRWPDGKPVCPRCRIDCRCYWLATQKRWKCAVCGKQFSVKVGTIFEDSPIPLDKWLTALWMLVNCKNGVSSYEVHRAIGVTQKTAWFMLHRLRFAMHSGFPTSKIGGPGNEVEADETFVGPKPQKMHRDRKQRYDQQREATGRGSTPVMGMLDRESREVRVKVVPDVKRDTLQKQILANVKYGSTIYTDDAVAYDELRFRYVHEVVSHAECYVRGRVSTNGIENFWSVFKRTLSGTYIAVEPFHLFRYADAQAFRFNNRGSKKVKVSDRERFTLALSQIAHKRLTYAELTGKTGSPANA